MATLSSPKEEYVSPEVQKSTSEAVALRSLFSRVAGLTILFIVVLLSIRGNADKIPPDSLAAQNVGWYNPAVFALSVIGAVVLVIRFVRRPTVKPSRIALVVCVVGMLFGIARVDRPTATGLFWEGFGLSVALVAIPVSMLIVPIAARIRRSGTLRYALTGLVIALALADLLSLIRDLGNFDLTYGNNFVLNEMLAPAAGRVPDANFVPQYTTLYGWLIFPFRSLLSASGLANMATILLSCFAVAAVVLAVVLARRTLPKRSLWVAVALTVPVATVTVLHGIESSSVADYLQELPVRIFPAMLFSLFATSSLMALLRRSVPKTALIGLGLLAGVMAWNSQDFGVAVTVAYGVVLQVAARGALRRRATLLWLKGLVPGLLLYPLWTLAIRHTIQLHYLGLTARAFGGGVINTATPIWIPGPVLIVMPLLISSAAVGWFLLWKASASVDERPGHHKYAIVTLALVGTWSVLAFPYYINAASADGQLQTFLLPFGVCCCALLSLCYPAIAGEVRRSGTWVARSRAAGALWLLPVTIPIGTCFGAILQTPNPSVAYNALTHPSPSIEFLAQINSAEIVAAKAYARAHGSGTVGYLGPDANYYHLITNVRPLILFDDPVDFLLSPSAHQLGCQFVRRHATRWLVTAPNISYPFVYRSIMKLATYRLLGTPICGIYEPVPLPHEPFGTFLKIVRPTSRPA
jgi:hypothetical protein